MSPASRAVRPWREVRSSRGRPKRPNTASYACDNEQCEYCGITVATIHALVGYGHHGVDGKIQDLFCQACGHKFSVRRHTALYRLKTPARRVAEVLAAVAEGLSVAAAARVFGHAEGTITAWLTRAGSHSAGLHTRLFTGLELLHVQLDELRTTLRNRGQAVWLWLALDARTKIIAAAEFGPRTQATAHALIHGLVRVLWLRTALVPRRDYSKGPRGLSDDFRVWNFSYRTAPWWQLELARYTARLVQVQTMNGTRSAVRATTPPSAGRTRRFL